MNQSIVLVGPMGAGKSTIGKLLASRLHYQFFDTDHVIEARTGADIPWIFDVEGEDGFRLRESSVLRELLEKDNTLIATGGGIVVRDENRELLKQSKAAVVYLTATIEQLLERTYKDKKRPLLQVDDPKAKIEELFYTRDPLYRDVATHIIETGSQNPKGLISRLISLLDAD